MPEKHRCANKLACDPGSDAGRAGRARARHLPRPPCRADRGADSRSATEHRGVGVGHQPAATPARDEAAAEPWLRKAASARHRATGRSIPIDRLRRGPTADRGCTLLARWVRSGFEKCPGRGRTRSTRRCGPPVALSPLGGETPIGDRCRGLKDGWEDGIGNSGVNGQAARVCNSAGPKSRTSPSHVVHALVAAISHNSHAAPMAADADR